MKACTKCHEVKTADSFYNSKNNKDGKEYHCKECKSIKYKKWREDNKEKAQATNRKWQRDNRDRAIENCRKWREDNAEHVRAYAINWRKENVDRRREMSSRWQEANIERSRANSRRWNAENRDRINAICRRRYNSDVEYRASRIIRIMLKDFLKRAKIGKSGSVNEVMGYTEEKLLQRMECQFKPGMSWNNHGEWHIDHKIPVAHFIAKGERRSRIVNALPNLQPMWAADNFSKGSKHPSKRQSEAVTLVLS